VLPEFLQNLDHPIRQKNSRWQLASDPRQDLGTHQLLLEFRLPNSPKKKKRQKSKTFHREPRKGGFLGIWGLAKEETVSWKKRRLWKK